MKSFFSWCCLFALVFFAPPLYAEELIFEFDPDEEVSLEAPQTNAPEVPAEALQPTVVDLERDAFLRGYQQLFELNQEELAGLQAVLLPVQEDLSNIDTQLNVLDLQMQRVRQLDQLLLQKLSALREVDTKLSVQEQLLALEMKDVIKKFERLLQLYYRIKRQYVREDGSVHSFQLLTSADSPADLLFQDFVLQDIQDQMLLQISAVSQQQLQLDQLRQSLALVGFQLSSYQQRAQQSATVLQQQRDYQQELLQEKQREQRFFLEKLQEAQQEQEAVLVRIRELATGVSAVEYAAFPEESFIWPVPPALGISAHFQEESYRKRFGLDHDAIDIPTDQLTPIQAPLSGKVLKVHDGGLGYSYLQLGHRDGLSTVYGHVYSFSVQEGDSVQQGQVIALSGGALGTQGAGRLTTGPHLHFEVLQDGQHVDPLLYLPNIDQ